MKVDLEKIKSVREKTLLNLLLKLSDSYYNSDKPEVHDETFDKIKDVYETRFRKYEYVGAVPSDTQENKKVKLQYWLGSLDKIKDSDKTISEVNNWVKTNPGPYVISEKLDGVSALYMFGTKETLYTRGDGITGVDISKLLKYINMGQKIEKGRTRALRGEIIMSKENFKLYENEFANPRNLVSGIVNSKNINLEIAKKLDFVVYESIFDEDEDEDIPWSTQLENVKKLGFNVVNFEKVLKPNLKDSTHPLHKLEKKLDFFKKKSKYEIDGIVIYDDLKSNIRYTKGNPKYAFAFKKIAETAVTKVIKVEWNVSKHGMLKPRIKIEPVHLSGTNIEYTTGFNAKYIFDNKIGKGSVIEVTRSGDVIPYILKVIEPTEPEMPDREYIWNETEVDILIPNIKDDIQVNVKKLVHFISKLEIKQISQKTIEKLSEAGFNTIQKLVQLKEKDICGKIEGIKEKSAQRIVQNIQNGIKNIKLETIMAASFCFDLGIGEKKIKLVIDEYPKILDFDEEDKKVMVLNIEQIKGFSKDSAIIFWKGLIKFKKFMKKTPEITIDMPIDKGGKPNKIKNSHNSNENNSSKVEEMTIVFSQFRNKNLQDKITELGGKVTTAVSKKTNLLIQGGNEVTEKSQKAEAFGVRIIQLSDFLKEFNINIDIN